MIKKPLIRSGTYKHFKGGLYKVISIAKHSETPEEMVVYKSLKDESQLWVRPIEIFCEKVDVKGKKIPRFEFIK